MQKASAAAKKKKAKKGMGMGADMAVLNRLKNNPHGDLPEEEQAYLKTAKCSKDCEAEVMAANYSYEQGTHAHTQARFKRDYKGLEVGRLHYSHAKMQQFVTVHRSYFRNETIEVWFQFET